jgi:hypothetical protein
VLVFRQPNGLFQSCFVDSNAGDDMVDSNIRKNLRRAFRLIGLNTHLISGNLLVVFLSKYGEDIERCATGQSNRNHLDWFCASSTRGVVQHQIVAASSSSHKLALLSKCLSELDFGGDHECLLQVHENGTSINAEGQDLLQKLQG